MSVLIRFHQNYGCAQDDPSLRILFQTNWSMPHWGGFDLLLAGQSFDQPACNLTLYALGGRKQ